MASGGSGAPLARPPTAPRRGPDHVLHLLERRNNSRVRPAIDGGTIPDDRQWQRGSAAATNDTVNEGSGSDGNGGGGGGRQRQHQHPAQRTPALTGRAVKHPLDHGAIAAVAAAWPSPRPPPRPVREGEPGLASRQPSRRCPAELPAPPLARRWRPWHRAHGRHSRHGMPPPSHRPSATQRVHNGATSSTWGQTAWRPQTPTSGCGTSAQGPTVTAAREETGDASASTRGDTYQAESRARARRSCARMKGPRTRAAITTVFHRTYLH